MSGSNKHKYFNAIAPVLVLSLFFSVSGLSLTSCQFKPKSLPGATSIHKDTVTLFFSQYQNGRNVTGTVVRKLPKSNTDPLQFALTELLNGPSAEEKKKGFYTEIPEGTKLLGLSVRKDTLTVDLSNHFNHGGGANSIDKRFEEVRQTVLSIDRTHKIKIAIDGKVISTLGGEGLEIDAALERKID